MRRDALVGLAFVSLTGCVGLRSDLRDVEIATHEHVADVTGDVDASDVPEAHMLLSSPVDADAAVRVALLNNRELRARLREIGVARGELVQASILPNPILEGELQAERDSLVLLRAEYDVTGLILAPLRARSAAPDVDAARYRAAGAVVETGWAARAAFYTLQAAEEKLALGNRALDALAASRDAARAYFAAGNITELEFATQESTYETERADVAQMELDAQDAREALVRILGVHGPDVAFSVKGPLASAPEKLAVPDDLEAQIIRTSFDLKERRARLTALGRRAGLARAEGWIPDVALDVHGVGPSGTPRDAADTEWLVGGGIRVTVPIFDRKQGTSAELSSQFDADLERYYGAASDARSMVRSVRARLVTAHARAKQYESVIVPARKRVVEQTLLHYNAMQLGVFQLVEAKRSELGAELARADALRDFWIARAGFDAAIAGRSVRVMKGGD